MKNDKIIAYIREYEKITVPMIQKQFSMNYSKAKAVVDELAKKGKIVYDSGVEYKVVEEKPKSPPRPTAQSQKSGSDIPISQLARMRRMAARADIPNPPDKEELDEKEKKALWICIKSNYVSNFPIARELNISPLEAYRIINALEMKGYLTRGPVRMPAITEEDFIEKFGKMDDADKSSSDSADESDSEKKSYSLDNYYELFRIKKIFNDCISNGIQGKILGDKHYCVINIGEERYFKFWFQNGVLQLSDGGFTFATYNKNTAKAQELLKDYRDMSYEMGEIKVTVEKDENALTALLELYAATERIKHLTEV